MKVYRIFAVLTLLTLTALPVQGQFQPGDSPAREHPECGFDYDCFREKEVRDKALNANEIQRQEEAFDQEETVIQNRKLEEIKRNSEQPGLNEERP